MRLVMLGFCKLGEVVLRLAVHGGVYRGGIGTVILASGVALIPQMLILTARTALLVDLAARVVAVT